MSSLGWNGRAGLGMPSTGPSASMAGFHSVDPVAAPRAHPELDVDGQGPGDDAPALWSPSTRRQAVPH